MPETQKLRNPEEIPDERAVNAILCQAAQVGNALLYISEFTEDPAMTEAVGWALQRIKRTG